MLSKNQKKINLDRFVYSLGIRHIGQENAKLMAQHLKNSENFFNLSKNVDIENLLYIDGIGETQIKSVKKFFSNIINQNILKELKKNMKISDSASIKLKGILKK